MGKARIKNSGLPQNVYLQHGAYYYIRCQKWKRLAKKGDYAGMYKALSEILQSEPRKYGMLNIFEKYEQEVLPLKAKKTVVNQIGQLQVLKKVFGKMEPFAIQPKHIAQYLERREAKVAANREIALLSHVFRKAIRWGLAEKNPCLLVERNQERPSD